MQSRIELVNADDYAYVDKTLKSLGDAEPSIAIAPDPATGGWLISTVGELQLDVFCKRLKKDHKCDIRIGAPGVRYLEKLKAPQPGLTNSANGMGAEIRITVDLAPLAEEEANSVTYGIPVSPALSRGDRIGFRPLLLRRGMRNRVHRGPGLPDHGNIRVQRPGAPPPFWPNVSTIA